MSGKDGTAVLADIGGTNTRVALGRNGAIVEGSVRRYRNAENDGIGAVLAQYLAETGMRPQAACGAVAGPVRDGAGRLTNIDWDIDRATLHAATGAEVTAVAGDITTETGRAAALAAGAARLPGDFALQGFQLFNEPCIGLVLVFLAAFLGACHSKPFPADQILLNDTTNVQA